MLPLTSTVLAKLTSSSPRPRRHPSRFQRPHPGLHTPNGPPQRATAESLLHRPSPPTFSQAPRQTPTASFRDASMISPAPDVPAPASQRPPRPSQAPAQLLLPPSHPTGPQTYPPAKIPKDPPNPPASDRARSAPSSAPRREPAPQPRCPPPRPQAPQPWLPRRADPCDVTAPSRARPQEVEPTTHWSVRPPLVKPAHRRLPGPGPRASRPPHQNAASPLAQARLPAGDWL